jgi:hypothetical protein
LITAMHFIRICAAVPQEKQLERTPPYHPDPGVKKSVILHIEQQKSQLLYSLDKFTEKRILVQ